MTASKYLIGSFDYQLLSESKAVNPHTTLEMTRGRERMSTIELVRGDNRK
jgi:hypothetical protein